MLSFAFPLRERAHSSGTACSVVFRGAQGGVGRG